MAMSDEQFGNRRTGLTAKEVEQFGNEAEQAALV
jgi:hypothetical protein